MSFLVVPRLPVTACRFEDAPEVELPGAVHAVRVLGSSATPSSLWGAQHPPPNFGGRTAPGGRAHGALLAPSPLTLARTGVVALERAPRARRPLRGLRVGRCVARPWTTSAVSLARGPVRSLGRRAGVGQRLANFGRHRCQTRLSARPGLATLRTKLVGVAPTSAEPGPTFPGHCTRLCELRSALAA